MRLFGAGVFLLNFLYCFANGELTSNFLKDDFKSMDSEKIILSLTMTGDLYAFDIENKNLLWKSRIKDKEMISSSLNNLEMFSDGVKTRLIPSLLGNLYQLKGDIIEPLSIHAADLLKSSMKISYNTMFTGSSEVQNLGIDLLSGKILYSCNSKGCSIEHSSTTNVDAPLLAVKITSNTVISFDTYTGIEKWNFSVSEIDMELTKYRPDSEGVISGNSNYLYEPEIQNNEKLESVVKFIIPEGIMYKTSKTNPSIIDWKVKLDSPITKSWLFSNGRLEMMDLFNSDDALNKIPAFYLGIYKSQAYIQEKYPMHKGISESLTEIFDAQNSLDCGYLLSAIHYKKYEAIGYQPKDEFDHSHVDNNYGFFIYAEDKVPDNNTFTNLTTHLSTVSLCPYSAWDLVLGVMLMFVIPSVLNAFVILYIWGKKFDSILFYFRNHKKIIVPEIASKSSSGSSRPSVSDNDSKFTMHFEVEKVLGTGGFGVVFQARNRIDDCTYAIKRIALPQTEKNRNIVMREVKAMALLHHPNIVRYFHSWVESVNPAIEVLLEESSSRTGGYHISDSYSKSLRSSETSYRIPSRSYARDHSLDHVDSDDSVIFMETDNKIAIEPRLGLTNSSFNNNLFSKSIVETESNVKSLLSEDSMSSDRTKNHSDVLAGDFVYIQMELCQALTLADILNDPSSRKEIDLKQTYDQILSAVDYIHSKKLIHRDIKPSNIFFSFDNVVKVGDLGLVANIQENLLYSPHNTRSSARYSFESHTKGVGTYVYMSPEQLNSRHYTYKVDIYALGITLFEILYPCKTSTEKVLSIQNIKKCVYPETFKSKYPVLHSLLMSMLNEIPDERPEVEEIRKLILEESWE